MSTADIDPESRCRIPLPLREDLDTEGQRTFDFYTSGTLRGLRGPAGIWLHSPRLAELYQPLGTYLRSGAGLSEPVREVCVLATAREFNNASSGRRTSQKPCASVCRNRSFNPSNSGSRAPRWMRRSGPSSN
ncbi:MAG: 4-carboxymuconolactone decarboxylase [Mycobacterium sp.]|nr:4-carboxymuconolactone decarboxylase [Mycobacterium sp.]